MFGSLGAPEVLLVALIGLLVFGTGRLPELGRGLGEGIRNLKQAMREAERGDAEQRDPAPATSAKSEVERQADGAAGRLPIA